MPKKLNLGLADLMLFAFAVLGAPNYAVMKIVMQDLPALVIATIRFTVSGLVILAVAYVVDGNLALPPNARLRTLLLGVTGIFGYQILFVNGLAATTSGNAALLVAMSPIFTTIYALAARTEKMTGKVIGGILMGFIGVFLIILGKDGSVGLGFNSLYGDLLMLLASVMWASYGIMGNSLIKSVSPIKATAYAMLSGAALLAIASGKGFFTANWGAVTPAAWWSLAYVTLISCGLVYVLWYLGVQRIGIARAMVYMYFQPIVAMITGAWLLHEKVSWMQILGAAVIIGSVAIVRRTAGTGQVSAAK